jgi:hypothetical protein
MATFGALALVSAAAAGCSAGAAPHGSVGNEELRTTGLAMTVNLLEGTDVAAFEFDIRQGTDSCASNGSNNGSNGSNGTNNGSNSNGSNSNGSNGAAQAKGFDPLVVTKDLGTLLQPVGDGLHGYADQFTVLPAGCYDVTVRPLTQAHAVSTDCAAASAKGLVVLEGQVREVSLLSQCKGEDNGAIQTTVTLNHPPVITNVEYSGATKLVETCEETQLCVTVQDPDGDAVRVELSQASGPAVYSGCGAPLTVPRARIAGEANEGRVCFSVVAADVGTAVFGLRAFDLGDDGATIESTLPQSGSTAQSHASLDGVELDAIYPSDVCWDNGKSVAVKGAKAAHRIAACWDDRAAKATSYDACSTAR